MQKSMLIGVCVAFISTIIAATVGAIAGYFGGWRDRTADVDRRPAAGGAELHPDRDRHPAPRAVGDRVFWLILLFAVFSWMISSRIVRGMTMSLREREFVTAARYMGVSATARIIVRHVLPNVASILIIDTTLNVGVAILAETGLSFLGFGIQPPDVSLGTLIADGTPSVTHVPVGVPVPRRRAGADRAVRQPRSATGCATRSTRARRPCDGGNARDACSR